MKYVVKLCSEHAQRVDKIDRIRWLTLNVFVPESVEAENGENVIGGALLADDFHCS